MTTVPTPRPCADCGAAFDAKYARFCSECTYKPANRRAGRVRAYAWTPERDKILRDHYDGKKGTAQRIARLLGWPRWVISKRAAALGLTQPKDYKPWRAAEVEFLLTHVNARTVRWIAKRLKRTETSVVMRIKRMGLSRQVDTGTYTARQVAEGFGIDGHVVERWIRQQLLAAKRAALGNNGGPAPSWQITPAAVREFVKRNPLSFDIRKVDQVWFLDAIGVVSGEVAA